MRQAPSFIICGAMKSGTTSLQKYLSSHKDIFMPDHELSFFDQEENYRKGTEFYLNAFTGYEVGQILGEKTPNYMYMEDVSERIHRHFPKVKLIFSLRNPVDRAYSHYWHEYKKLRESLSFEKAIKKESCIKEDCYHKTNFSYLSKGRYAVQIERFLQSFPRSQMLFVIYEDFRRDPLSTVKTCFRFLGMDDGIEIDICERYNQTVIPKSQLLKKGLIRIFPQNFPFYNRLKKIYSKLNSQAGYPEMDPNTRKKLIDYFREDNKRLESLLNIDLSYWNV